MYIYIYIYIYCQSIGVLRSNTIHYLMGKTGIRKAFE